MKCSILQCGARKNKYRPNLTFHRIPRNEDKKRIWLEAIGKHNLRTDVKCIYICSEHFDDNAFNRTLDVMRLRDEAVPSLFQKVPSIQKRVLKEEKYSHEEDPLSSIDDPLSSIDDPLSLSSVIPKNKSLSTQTRQDVSFEDTAVVRLTENKGIPKKKSRSTQTQQDVTFEEAAGISPLHDNCISTDEDEPVYTVQSRKRKKIRISSGTNNVITSSKENVPKSKKISLLMDVLKASTKKPYFESDVLISKLFQKNKCEQRTEPQVSDDEVVMVHRGNQVRIPTLREELLRKRNKILANRVLRQMKKIAVLKAEIVKLKSNIEENIKKDKNMKFIQGKRKDVSIT